MRMVPVKRQRVERSEPARIEYIPMGGGEDLISPALSIQPGSLRYSLNYEPAQAMGYRRIDGFERLDGQPKPSDATYWILNFTAGDNEPTIGGVAIGATSGATGEVLAVVVTYGAWATSDAVGYLVLLVVSGTFQDNEPIVAPLQIGLADGTAMERSAPSDAEDASYSIAAASAARSLIGVVPGTGPLRGVWSYASNKYAFRDYTDSEGRMYVSSTTGWQQVDLGRKLDFTSGGVTEIVDGDVIVGETSGATAVVERSVVTSGTWAGGTAAGYFVISGQTGTFISETIKVGASLNLGTIAGNSDAIVFAPGGRYEFVNYSFSGAASGARMYGCDGVNKAFEFDGTVFCPITTGMATDTPRHINAHKNHLFLSFPNGSVQHSGIGTPLTWAVVTGASEIGTGDDVTGMEVMRGGVMGIFNRNRTYTLYGSSASDWDLRTHSDESGAIEWSVQTVGSPRYLDDRGLTMMEAVDTYGDFNSATFSQRIQPHIGVKLKESSVTASVRVKTKDQYRIFFADGDGLIAKFRAGGKVEFTRINLGKIVRCACSSENSDGTEILLFGSDDGYVYEMDSGTSFDGEPVEAYVRMPFGHFKSPQQIKRFFKAVLELDAPNGSTLSFTQEYDYGSSSAPRGITQDIDVNLGGGYWGAAEWGQFIWGGQAVSTADAYLDGSGKNMGLYLRSYATHERPHTINGISIHFAMRGRVR